jgi:hypothetical protein
VEEVRRDLDEKATQANFRRFHVPVAEPSNLMSSQEYLSSIRY